MSDGAKITSLEKKLDVASKTIADLETKVSVLTGQNQDLRNKAAEARREQNLREPDAREKNRHEEMKKSMREEINRLTAEYTTERKLHQNAVREREKVVQEANQVNKEWLEKDQRSQAEKAELELQVRDLESWLEDEKNHVQRQRQALQLLQDEVASQKSAARAFEAERDRVKDEVYDLNKKIDVLATTNEKLRLEGTDHREELKSLRTKIGALQVENEQRLQQFYAQEGVLASHDQSLRAAEEDKRGLVDTIQQRELEVSRLTDKISALEQDIIIQRSVKEELEETLHRERSRADREQKVSSDIDTGYRQLQKRYDSLFERHQEKERECIAVKAQNTTLERDLEGLKEERSKLTESVKKLEAKKVALEEKVNLREREVSLSQNQLSKEAQSLTERLEDLQSQLTHAAEAKARAEESVAKAEDFNIALQKQVDDQLAIHKDLSMRHDDLSVKLSHEQEALTMAREEVNQLKETIANLHAEMATNAEVASKRAEKLQRQVELLESRRSALEAANKQLESQLEETDHSSKSQRSANARKISSLETDLAAAQRDKAELEDSIASQYRSLEKVQALYARECEARETEAAELGTALRSLRKEHAAALDSLATTAASLQQQEANVVKITKAFKDLTTAYDHLKSNSAFEKQRLQLKIDMNSMDRMRLGDGAEILVAQREKKEARAQFAEGELEAVCGYYGTVARSLGLVASSVEKHFVSLEKLIGDEAALECRAAFEAYRSWRKEEQSRREQLNALEHAQDCKISELRRSMSDKTIAFKELETKIKVMGTSSNGAGGSVKSASESEQPAGVSRCVSYTAPPAASSIGTKRERSAEKASLISNANTAATRGMRVEEAPASSLSNLGSRAPSQQQAHSVSRPLDDRILSQHPSVSPVPVSPSIQRQQRDHVDASRSDRPERLPPTNSTRSDKNVSLGGSHREDSTGVMSANRRALDEWTSTNSNYVFCSNLNSPNPDKKPDGLSSVSPGILDGASPFKTGRVSAARNLSSQQPSASLPLMDNAFEDGRVTVHK